MAADTGWPKGSPELGAVAPSGPPPSAAHRAQLAAAERDKAITAAALAFAKLCGVAAEALTMMVEQEREASS